MTAQSVLIAGLMSLAGTAGALAEDTICTPAFYFNTDDPKPQIIPIDAARLAGSRVTSVDIETGAFHENIGAVDGRLVETGKLRIVNKGSMQERIDFVALNDKTGLVIHISLIDQDLPFTRVDKEGTVASGHCVYEYDQ
jgi:hypothetical protein